MINTPKSCSQCQGKLEAQWILKEFAHQYADYGHARCRKCGISFDSNINQVSETKIDSAAEIQNLDEKDYRGLFVETSKIADEKDNIYASFDWDNNDEVKAGVANHVIKVIESQHSDGISNFADVGCGSGFMSFEIAKIYNDATVHAIDPSPLVTQLKQSDQVKPHQGTLQTANLDGDSIDALSIIGNWMLHMDPIDTLKETKRVLRPGGTLILDFKNIKSASRVVASIALRLGLDRFGGRHMLQRNFVNMRYGFNKKYVLRSLEEQGFSVVSIHSKPPRLLEFNNKSHYQKGLTGAIWRFLNKIDGLRNEQAWIQIVAKA